MIAENLERMEKEIEQKCLETGRDVKEVTVIAVSKTKPVEMLEEAYAYGCRDFGENKVQELLDKYERMPKDIKWHMIGHLQRNKVKYIIDKVAFIHSVDSLKLAEEISKQAVLKEVEVPVLVEVNVAQEDTKFGITCEDTLPFLEKIAKLPGILVKGLMTIAPYVENPESNKQYFAALKQLSVDIKRKNIDNVSVDVLSMGMSGDYLVAVSEGATMIRVGTGIFGERQYEI